jgi:integrase
VFLSPEGCRLYERNLVRSFQECAKGARLRKTRLHDLRHTFASQLIEQGAHPKYIQEQLGHSSINVTMDTYGHLFPNRNRGLVDRLDTVEVGWDSAPQQHPRREVSRVPIVTPRELVRPEGLEPPTPRSVDLPSIPDTESEQE